MARPTCERRHGPHTIRNNPAKPAGASYAARAFCVHHLHTHTHQRAPMTDITSNVTPLRRSRKAVRQRNAERQCRYRQPKAGKVLDAELPSTSPPVAPPPVAIRNAARNAAAITAPENNHVSRLMLPEGVSDRDYEPAPNPVSNYAHSHVSDCPRRCRCRIATSRQDHRLH
jgi:hypothetical protein